MRLRLTVMVAVMVSMASVCDAQPATTSQTRDTPDFRVETWGHVVAEFGERLEDYSSLRSELEKGLPPLRVTDDAATHQEGRARSQKENPRGARRRQTRRHLHAGDTT